MVNGRGKENVHGDSNILRVRCGEVNCAKCRTRLEIYDLSLR